MIKPSHNLLLINRTVPYLIADNKMAITMVTWEFYAATIYALIYGKVRWMI
jgi:hypothetical protein